MKHTHTHTHMRGPNFLTVDVESFRVIMMHGNVCEYLCMHVQTRIHETSRMRMYVRGSACVQTCVHGNLRGQMYMHEQL